MNEKRQQKELQSALAASFDRKIEGIFHTAAVHKAIYSTDASIYQKEPLAVLYPKTEEDLYLAIEVCKELAISLTARGAATGVTGGCLGDGLIVDMSRFMRDLHPFEQGDRVRCQSGAVADSVNQALLPFGKRLAVDISTGNRATIGGMVANNAAGIYSLRLGSMAAHIDSCTLFLSSGDKVRLEAISLQQWQAATQKKGALQGLLSSLWEIRQEHITLLQTKLPHLSRISSGYLLQALLASDRFNPAQLICGSEGSLGVIAEVTLNGIIPPKERVVVLLFFTSQEDAFKALPSILEHDPIAVEMVDEKIVLFGRSSPQLKGKIEWLPNVEAAMLIVEFGADSSVFLEEQVDLFIRQISSLASVLKLQDHKAIETVWQLRKAGLGLLMSKRSFSRAVAFLEDLALPPERLAHFMGCFSSLLRSYGKEAGVYGHVGASCMHIRPYLDLRSGEEQKILKDLMIKTTQLIIEEGGVLSGEHGDGIVRSWLNKRLFGEELYAVFGKVKKAFDQEGLMNKGKVVGAEEQLPLNFRKSAVDQQEGKAGSYLDFSEEGGIALSVDLCNGNGLCRKSEGVMCPSYQASHDEYDSTRARANALRAALQGGGVPQQLADPSLGAILDLCIACKGCKRECPSQVDMARLKAEVLYHQPYKGLKGLRDFLFAHIGSITRLMQPLHRFIHRLASTSAFGFMLNQLGITTAHRLPLPAKKTFSQLVKLEESSSQDLFRGPVLLFSDTFTQFIHPEVGLSAYRLLKALGYQPLIQPWSCCGRTYFSKGYLSQAKQKMDHLLLGLQPYLEEGLCIIVLEPSCLSMLLDDGRALLPAKRNVFDRLKSSVYSFEQFLLEKVGWFELQQLIAKNNEIETGTKIFFHPHCHERALFGRSYSKQLLEKIPSIELIESDAGCCGMAGSFGYEAEHYPFSQKIASLRLYPQIEALQEVSFFCSNGTSCRSQIDHKLNSPTFHMSQLLELICLNGINSVNLRR